MNKYFAKIIASDQEGLQLISACSSGAKVKVSDIKYLASSKVFFFSIERTKIETNQENKKINNDLVIIYPSGDEWILRGLSKDLTKELLNQNLNVNYMAFKKLKDNLNYRNFLIIGLPLAKKILRDFPFIINKSSI